MRILSQSEMLVVAGGDNPNMGPYYAPPHAIHLLAMCPPLDFLELLGAL